MIVSIPVSRSAVREDCRYPGFAGVEVELFIAGVEVELFTTAPDDLAQMGTFLLVVEAFLG
jgi:hypothetical protein